MNKSENIFRHLISNKKKVLKVLLLYPDSFPEEYSGFPEKYKDGFDSIIIYYIYQDEKYQDVFQMMNGVLFAKSIGVIPEYNE